ncbi:hypothetical protein ABZP36_017046 [Zizania latifolia]
MGRGARGAGRSAAQAGRGAGGPRGRKPRRRRRGPARFGGHRRTSSRGAARPEADLVADLEQPRFAGAPRPRAVSASGREICRRPAASRRPHSAWPRPRRRPPAFLPAAHVHPVE